MSDLVLKFIDKLFLNNNLMKLNEKEIIEIMYEKLTNLENFNFISGYELYRFLIDKFEFEGSVAYNIWGSAYLYIQNERVLQKLKNIFELNDNAKVEFIKNIFQKSGIRGITKFENNFNKKPIIYFENNYQIADEFIYFDTKKIKEKILVTTNELERAYCYYQLEDYIQAFDTLETASLNYFKKRKFLLYFISEFNKHNLYPLIKFNIEYDKEIKEKILLKFDKRESLFDLYEKLPKIKRKNIKFLLNYENYIEAQYIKSNEFLEDLEKSNNRLDYSVGDLYNFTMDVLYQIHLNYLCVDENLKDVYKNIFKSIVYAYKYKKIPYIAFPFVFVGIKGFSNWKELQTFLNDIELELTDKEHILINDYQIIYKNLEKLFLESDIYSTYIRYFKTYFIILTYSKLSTQDINIMAKTIIKILNEKMLMIDDYQLIDMFVSKHSSLIDKELLKNILESFINKFIWSKFNFYDLNTFDYSFFGKIFSILKDNNIKLSKEKIISFLSFIKQIQDIEIKFKAYSYFLTGLYILTNNKKIKKELLDFKEKLKKYTKKTITNDFMEDISIDKKYKFYEYLLVLYFYDIDDEIEQYKEKLKDYIEHMEGFCSCLSQILYLLKIIKQKKNTKLFDDIIKLIEDKIQEYNKMQENIFSKGKK